LDKAIPGDLGGYGGRPERGDDAILPIKVSFSIHAELLRDAGDLDRIFRVNPHSSYF
jgi:hypothetical protein